MINGAHVILFAPDPAPARAFFDGTLRLRSVDAGGGWPIFGLPPAELAVHPTDGEPRQELYLMCSDLEATRRDLEARGARLSADVEEQPFGLLTSVDAPGFGAIGLYEAHHPRPRA